MEFHRCDFEGMPVQVQDFMQLVRGVPAEGEGRRWQERANCLGVDPDLFFPERGASPRPRTGP